MGAIKVKVKGSFALARQFERAKTEILPKMLPVVAQTAQKTLSAANSKIPVDTGTLRSSGAASQAGIRHETTAFATAGYSDPKAPFVHEGFFGTENPVGTPPKFLRDAAREQKKELRQEVRKTFKAELKRIFPQQKGRK